MKSELNEMEEQEEKQYDLLEKKVYSEELFLKRNKALKAKMEELKTRIFETSKDLPKEIDYAEKIVTLKNAIEALRNENLSAEAKNKLLKTIIERIEYEFTESEGHGKTRYALHIRLLV